MVNMTTNAEVNPLQQVKSKLQNPGSTNLLLVNEERLFVFFSVDICNSTKLKSNNEEWFEANKLLYNEQMTQLHFWKYNGDEVLYAEPFSDIKTLAEIIKESYLYIKRMQNEMRKKLKEDDFELKGTLWLARTSTGEDKKPNLHIKSSNFSNEFLGYNIDEGFRLTKKISGSKIAIDAKIVFLLLLINDIYNNKECFTVISDEDDFFKFARNIDKVVSKQIKEVLTNTYFINYSQLKGIWDNRKYPIFWYYEDRRDYAYDEQLDDNYNIPEPLLNSDWEIKIEHIFHSVNAMDEFLKILKIISSPKTSPYSWESFSRLYYSVACINPKTQNILVLQRSNQRKHLKGLWEFVPYKHTSKETVSSIEKKFSDEFNFNIKIVTDNEDERNIYPIHFCTIYRNGQAHNSLLCMAIIELDESDEEILAKLCANNSGRYMNYKFVNEENLDEFKPISIKEIEIDSLAALSNNSTPVAEGTSIMYLKKSINAIKNYYKRIQNNINWYEEWRDEHAQN